MRKKVTVDKAVIFFVIEKIRLYDKEALLECKFV